MIYSEELSNIPRSIKLELLNGKQIGIKENMNFPICGAKMEVPNSERDVHDSVTYDELYSISMGHDRYSNGFKEYRTSIKITFVCQECDTKMQVPYTEVICYGYYRRERMELNKEEF